MPPFPIGLSDVITHSELMSHESPFGEKVKAAGEWENRILIKHLRIKNYKSGILNSPWNLW